MAEGMQQGSIVIDATPKQVMDEIADYEAYPEWIAEFKKVEVRDRDDKKRGKHVYWEVAQGPLKANYVLEYTYKDGDAGVSWTMTEGNNMKRVDGGYDLEPADGGKKTKVNYEMRVDTPLPIPGFVRRGIERRAIDTALKGLKKRVEGKL
jgi:ribosome-associated toxin RatA of RatAB toxin-antitoxin module